MKLTDVMNQTELTYLQVSPKHINIHFSLSTHQGTVLKIDHILRNKASTNRNKKIEITFCILSDQQGLKLEHNRNNKKHTDS